MTPENFKKWIDSVIEEQGVKAFIVSGDKHGTALAPSKKCDLYRIPLAVTGTIFNESNLGYIVEGVVAVLTINNLDLLSESARKAYNENKKRKAGE
jgi:hypothetical protein